MPTARKLGKRADQRRAMLRGMVTLLLDKGRIETTLARAKELKRVADKMITIGKKNTLAAKRAAMAYITKEDVVKKLFDQIAPSFEDRHGGYTRVLKLGPRRGDGSEMAIIELVNFTPKDKKDKSKKAKEPKETKDNKKETKSDEKKETAAKPRTPRKPKAVEEPKKAEAEEVKEVKTTKPRAPRKPKAVEEVKEPEVSEVIEPVQDFDAADEVTDDLVETVETEE